MKTLSAIMLSITLLVTVTTFGQAPAPVGPPTGPEPLLSTGVPAGPAELVLPKGAILHARLNNLEALANDLNDLVIPFLPEETLPPELREMLATPKPLLTFLGSQTIDAPLTAENLTQLTGVDAERAISLTLYPGQDSPVDFVLCLPSADATALTRMVMNVLAPRQYQPMQTPQGQFYVIRPTNPTFPDTIYAACSEKEVYLTSSAQIATTLASAPGNARLTALDFLARAVKSYEDKNILIALDAAFLQQFIPMVEQNYGTIPQQIIRQLRSFTEEIDPGTLMELDLRLRFQFGINGLEELLDYIECFATATYEVVVNNLLDYVRAAEGLTLSLDLDGKFQTINIAYFSRDIDPASATAALPMPEVEKAIARLPGDRSVILISGRKPAAKQSEFTNEWLALLESKLQSKELQDKRIDAFTACLKQRRPKQKLESIAKWMVSTSLARPMPETDDYDTLQAYWNAAAKSINAGASLLSIMPAGEPRMLEAYCQAEVDTMNSNMNLDLKMNREVFDSEPFFVKNARLDSSSHEGGIERLAIEKSYTGGIGLFGYDEIEFIARRLLFYRKLDNDLFIIRGQGDPDWLTMPDLGKNEPLSGSLTKLLSLTPEKTSSIEIVQLIQYVPEFIDELAKEERLIHKELDAYLAESATALSRQRLQSNLKQELAAKMPFMVASLNIDSNTRKPYCVLPGNLVYPRSLVMPLISDLLKNFRARSKTMGGGIAFTRTLPGRKEVQLVQSTEAIAYLIRSVANAYFTNYMATPDGQQALMQSIIMPKDGHIPANEIIAHSPLWKRVLKVDEQDKARSRGRTRR